MKSKAEKKDAYYIATHVSYNSKHIDNYGPPHYVYDFLKKNKKTVYFIKHCLQGEHDSIFIDERKSITKKIYMGKNFLATVIQHIFLNISMIDNKQAIYIGVNPINGFSGVILKKLGRIKTFIYFTPDYADKRFKNTLLNAIYHVLDIVSLKSANEVWSVSSRIVKKRKKQGVDDSRNKLLPNSPNIADLPIRNNSYLERLIIVSHLTKSLNLEPILQSVKALRKKTSLELTIIGSGPELQNMKSRVNELKLGKSVHFLGPLPHKEVLKEISKSFIGLALYTKENSWNMYGDSMKAREYVACGIPVIINSIPSTADDIKLHNAGLVLTKIDVKKITEFVAKCMNDKRFYDNMCQNAVDLGKKFDKETVLKQLLLNK